MANILETCPQYHIMSEVTKIVVAVISGSSGWNGPLVGKLYNEVYGVLKAVHEDAKKLSPYSRSDEIVS